MVVATGGELETGVANILVPEVLRIEANAFDVLVAGLVVVAGGIEKAEGEGVTEKGAACRPFCQRLS